MNTLVIEVRRRVLEYTWFEAASAEPALTGSIDRVKVHSARAALSLIREHLRTSQKVSCSCAKAGAAVGVADKVKPDVVAFRVPFGGTEFPGPVIVDAGVLQRLDDLSVYAPLHLPSIVALLREAEKAFATARLVAAFETSFFADLPAKEHLYAVDAAVTRSMQLRRFGYHGILHQAACEEVARGSSNARLLSICLEPRPEVAAVVGGRPVMVTGGATPLEGLPGEKACGDIDPGIVLTLSQREDLGLEQINLMLTQESGLLGLTGEPVTLPRIFADESPRHRLARDFIRYRLLLACGAGKATMGGVDRLVFSGKYFSVGESLGPWLAPRLAAHHGTATPGTPGSNGKQPAWSCFMRSRPQIILRAALQAAAL